MKLASFLLTASVAVLLLTGCGKKKTDPAALEAAFKSEPAAEAAATPTPEAPAVQTGEARKLAQDAAAAIRKDDYSDAIVLLQQLRTSRGLTADQLTAAQETMARFQADLAAKADAGDQKAKAALALISARTRFQ
jgi:hypothetical protein